VIYFSLVVYTENQPVFKKREEKPMVNKKFWLGILVMALVFGMMVVGCPDLSGGGGNTDPKTLIITDIPKEVYDFVNSLDLGLFPAGTTTDQANPNGGTVSGYGGIGLEKKEWIPISVSVSNNNSYTFTLDMFTEDGPGNWVRWTGNARCEVFLVLKNSSNKGRYYKTKSAVSITSATTTTSWNNFELFWQDS
jgi:hypothetical protein